MSTRVKWIILGFLLASISAWAAATHINRFIFRETPEITGSNAETISNATNGTWSFGAATVATTGTITIDSSPLLKTLTVPLADSLSQTTRIWPAVLTLESDITVLRAQVTTTDSVTTAACSAVFFSGTTRDSVSVARATFAGATTTDYNFSAAAVCSVKTVPGTSATGGNRPMLVLQYTDKDD